MPDIDRQKQLFAWLNNKSRRVAQVLAVRAALRVYPVTFWRIFSSHQDFPFEELPKSYVIGATKAAFASWAALVFPEISLAEIDLSPNWRPLEAGSENQSELAVSAAMALGTAANTCLFSSTSLADRQIRELAASAVANAANAMPSGQTHLIWQSVNADIEALAQLEPARLIRQPLWLQDVRNDPKYIANFPPSIREPFDAFDKKVAQSYQSWRVWLSWY